MINTFSYRKLEFDDYPKNTLLAKQRDEKIKENMEKFDKLNNKGNLRLLKQLINNRIK